VTQPVRGSEPVVGQPIVRVDGPLKVTGQARYAAYNPQPNLAYAVLVCSTVALGSVERIDGTTALAHPDVLRVLTDFSTVKLPFDPRRVAFYGQPVAMVVASTLEAAMHGASLVDVRYTSQPSLTDIDSPQAVMEIAPDTPDYARGDADAALRSAAVVTDLRYTIARNNHNPMELPSTVASWDGDQLTVWDKVQGITSAQSNTADAVGVPVDNVRVLAPFVGGAFGSAGRTWPHQVLAAFAARQMRRPVKLVLTRKQMYSGIGYRPTSRQRLAIGADRSGRITTTVHEGHTEAARYQLYEEGLMGLPRFVYSSPNMRSTYRVVRLDVNMPTYTRGPGESSGAFALESAMDDLAHRLGMDPIELRLRNEPAVDQETDRPFSTRRLTDCLKQGATSFRWSVRGAGQGERRRYRRRADRDHRHGPGNLHVDDAGRGGCPRHPDAPDPIRPRRQPLSQGARAFGVEDHGQRRIGRLHGVEHAARQIHSHRSGGPGIASERRASRWRVGGRRPDVSNRGPGERRDLSGPAASP
jgi:xanthine dehydrogenase YagR molybdenum-binding subunit